MVLILDDIKLKSNAFLIATGWLVGSLSGAAVEISVSLVMDA